MDRITNRIFIGNIDDGNNKDMLLDNNIDAVLCVARERNASWPDQCDPENIDIEYHKVGLDMADNINTPNQWLACVSVIDQMMDRNRNLLVFCHAGAQRAPSVVSLYLSIIKNWSMKDSYEFVKSSRSQTDPWPQHIEETNAALKQYRATE